MIKKGFQCKTSHWKSEEKVKKKVNLRVLGMSPYVLKGVPQLCLDPQA
jgi:Iap family predicted aminopeptidase